MTIKVNYGGQIYMKNLVELIKGYSKEIVAIGVAALNLYLLMVALFHVYPMFVMGITLGGLLLIMCTDFSETTE